MRKAHEHGCTHELSVVAGVLGRLLLTVGPTRGHRADADPFAFHAPWIVISTADRQRLGDEVIVRILPCRDREVAVLAATRLNAPAEALAIWTRSILDLRRSTHVKAIGRISDTTPYGLRVQVPLSYDEAVARTTAALKHQGFGVLTTIDVKDTLKQKLDVDFRRYVILGSCNPPLAHQALQTELDVGLLLPCNVVVYEHGPTSSIVAALAPLAMLGLVGDNPGVAAVAREADDRLRHALTSLERG